MSELVTTSVWSSSISETDDALRSVKQKLLCFRERKKTQNQNPKTKNQNHQYGQTYSWMLRPNLTSILSWPCYFIGFWPHFCPTLWWLSLVLSHNTEYVGKTMRLDFPENTSLAWVLIATPCINNNYHSPFVLTVDFTSPDVASSAEICETNDNFYWEGITAFEWWNRSVGEVEHPHEPVWCYSW